MKMNDPKVLLVPCGIIEDKPESWRTWLLLASLRWTELYALEPKRESFPEGKWKWVKELELKKKPASKL